jgi:(1->4)-alpha-D-glucan 1-alpha-D-glucosylmutase
MLEEIAPWLVDDPASPAAAQVQAIRELLANWHDGQIKLLVTAAGLRLRRRLPHVFQHGDYVPLAAVGERADHVVAIARPHASGTVMAVAPRLVAALTAPDRPLPIGAPSWQTTRLALPPEISGGAWHNLLTGETLQWEAGDSLAVADVLGVCPVALLVRQ